MLAVKRGALRTYARLNCLGTEAMEGSYINQRRVVVVVVVLQ